MKKILIAAAALALALSGCAAVQQRDAPPAEACFSPEYEPAKVRADIAAVDSSVTYRELSAAERARFLKAWNEFPPVGGYLYDTIAYFDKPGAPTVGVVFIERGCIWTHQAIPREPFFAVVRGGTGS